MRYWLIKMKQNKNLLEIIHEMTRLRLKTTFKKFFILELIQIK